MRRDWTGKITLKPLRKIDFARTSASCPSGRINGPRSWLQHSLDDRRRAGDPNKGATRSAGITKRSPTLLQMSGLEMRS